MMESREWFGLEELGRGAARPLDPVTPDAVGVRGGVRVAPPCEAGESSERKLDELLCAARALGESMSAHAESDAAREEALAAVSAALEDLSRRFDARIAKSEYEEAMLKTMSDEVRQHRDGMYRKIIVPLVNEVIDVHEDMGATVARHRRALEAGDDPARAAAGMLRDLDEFRLMLGDILRNWNVDVWRPLPGDELEPLRCRAVRAAPTGDAAKHRTVAEAITSGYSFDGSVLRPAQVVAYSYEASLAPDGHPQEEECASAAQRQAAQAQDRTASEAEAHPPAASAPPARAVPPAPPAPPAPCAKKAGDAPSAA